MGRSIVRFLRSILPGIFLLGFNIGTGSVTAMAKAGATYGMSLLWTIFLSCAVTFVLMVAYGDFTLKTGETALQAFRRYIHPGVGVFFMVALTVAISASVIGVMGIIADVCSVWSRSFVPGGIDARVFAGFFILVVYGIFWQGQTEFFQRALAAIVAVMAVSFLLNFFVLSPPPGELLRGLIPTIPGIPDEVGKGPFLVIASMVGTTVFSGLFIIRTTLMKESGWSREHLWMERRDALISAGMMFVISAAIMASAAGTLFVRHLGLTEASQMVELLRPIAGPLATAIFVTGIVAAGISSQFPNVLLLPWLLCDYQSRPREMTLLRYRLIVLGISLLGLVVPVFRAKPVPVMIASQVFSAIMLPATVLAILYLGNRRQVVGHDTFSPVMNGVLGLILGFSFIMSWIGLRGILERI